MKSVFDTHGASVKILLSCCIAFVTELRGESTAGVLWRCWVPVRHSYSCQVIQDECSYKDTVTFAKTTKEECIDKVKRLLLLKNNALIKKPLQWPSLLLKMIALIKTLLQ